MRDKDRMDRSPLGYAMARNDVDPRDSCCDSDTVMKPKFKSVSVGIGNHD